MTNTKQAVRIRERRPHGGKAKASRWKNSLGIRREKSVYRYKRNSHSNKTNSNSEVSTRSIYGLLFKAAYSEQCFIVTIPSRQDIVSLLSLNITSNLNYYKRQYVNKSYHAIS